MDNRRVAIGLSMVYLWTRYRHESKKAVGNDWLSKEKDNGRKQS